MHTSAYFSQKGFTPNQMLRCFETQVNSRRWVVHTPKFSYSFLWTHLAYARLNIEATELILYTPEHRLSIQGVHLKPLHEAIIQETLASVKAVDAVEALEFSKDQTVVHSIWIEAASKFKKNESSESSE